MDNQSLFPPVVTSGFFFKKINCELWKIIENYCFIIESEGYLNFQKFYFCSQEVMQQLRLLWHRVYASRDVGNAAKQISLKQNKQITKEVNAGVSKKLIQVRVTIFAIFCIQHENFPHRWTPVVHPWPPQNVS